jgi:hypothetical protein
MNGGAQSKLYKFNNCRIHCQPITYTTKLADVRDNLKYLQGKIYQEKNPNLDINFFNIFFRGIDKKQFFNKTLKKPGEIINGQDNNYDLYIFEICSTREILFNTNKYGEEYFGKNLNWNIDIGNHNTIYFNKNDFLIIDNLNNSLKILEEINELCKGKKILIIGPYLLKNDTNERTPWGEIDLDVKEYVNKYRNKVINDLKHICSKFENIDYFDMSEYISKENILQDQYHFNKKGKNILSNVILSWINKNII